MGVVMIVGILISAEISYETVETLVNFITNAQKDLQVEITRKVRFIIRNRNSVNM